MLFCLRFDLAYNRQHSIFTKLNSGYKEMDELSRKRLKLTEKQITHTQSHQYNAVCKMASSLILNNEAISEIALLAADTTGKRDLVETCVSLYDQGRYDQVYDTLFSALGKVIENAPENDAESFVLVLVNILLKTEKKDDKIQQLIKLITETSETSKHRLRLRLYVYFYF